MGCLHAFVEGRVQGVGFRYFVQEWANQLGLSGWVRNVGEDQVEVWAEGPQEALNQLHMALQRGPRSSYVSDVRLEVDEPTGRYLRFQIISSSY